VLTPAWPVGDDVSRGKLGKMRSMASTELVSSMIVFAEERNSHGKLFGGFTARHAFDQAYFAAYSLFGEPPTPLGFDQVHEDPCTLSMP